MKKVIMYTSNNCSHCQTAKTYLRDKGIDYEERNITIDRSAKAELMKLGARGVPSFLIDGELIIGFYPEKIEELLDYVVIDCPSCKIGLRLPKNKGDIKLTCPRCKTEIKTRT